MTIQNILVPASGCKSSSYYSSQGMVFKMYRSKHQWKIFLTKTLESAVMIHRALYVSV